MSRTAVLEGMTCRTSAELSALLDVSLTAAQREYLLLYYREGLKMSEIACRCGVVPSTVSRTIARAEKRLRRAAVIANAIKPRHS